MNVINTNTSALRATNASVMAGKMLGTSMERLSTGKRINSGADDAAGLAIANSMTSQIRGMSQGVRNANDGISLAQTAEGALNEVTNMLQRIRELAVQAGSDTYADTDRDNIQAEVDELTAQIGQVVDNTEFNGINLFSTATNTITIQAGANDTDTIDITLDDLATDLTAGAGTAGLFDVTGTDGANARAALT
ncbi:MAG: flagellin FliC, partial [Sphingomonadales bacterium]